MGAVRHHDAAAPKHRQKQLFEILIPFAHGQNIFAASDQLCRCGAFGLGAQEDAQALCGFIISVAQEPILGFVILGLVVRGDNVRDVNNGGSSVTLAGMLQKAAGLAAEEAVDLAEHRSQAGAASALIVTLLEHLQQVLGGQRLSIGIDHTNLRVEAQQKHPVLKIQAGFIQLCHHSQVLRDGATLPLNFEPVPVELHVNQEVVDAEFDRLAAQAGLTAQEKSDVARRIRMEAIMKSPDRIQKVCEHIVNHFLTKVDPNGFKGQVVCYDRESCVLYKKAIDKLLGDDHYTTIVMDTNNDKEDKYKEWRRDRDEEAKLLDRFRDPNDPLKLVIVTAKLLTGFDAPILQVMYLDKPMKDHTLLQAICRVNRVYGQDKSNGLIVDYIGIFDDVAKALNFDESTIQKVITNIEEVKKVFPNLMEKCLAHFLNVDRSDDGWEGLMAAQECLPTNKEKDEFGADYRVINRAYNALSPDPFLHQYLHDYRWLSKVYESVKPVDTRGPLIWASVGAKTMELVHENISVSDVEETAPEDILELDAELIDDFIAGKDGAKKKAKKIEIDLVARILVHGKDPRFIKLGERLEELREKHEQGLITSIEFLKRLLELAKEAVQAEKEVVPVAEVDKGKAALTELFNGVRCNNTPVIVERIVKDIDDIVRIVRFDGWQTTVAGKREVKRALRSVVSVKYKIKDKELFDKAYGYIEQYY